MTSNQLAWLANQETIRANKAKEEELHRSNVAKENENFRSNKMKEYLNQADIVGKYSKNPFQLLGAVTQLADKKMEENLGTDETGRVYSPATRNARLGAIAGEISGKVDSVKDALIEGAKDFYEKRKKKWKGR